MRSLGFRHIYHLSEQDRDQIALRVVRNVLDHYADRSESFGELDEYVRELHTLCDQLDDLYARWPVSGFGHTGTENQHTRTRTALVNTLFQLAQDLAGTSLTNIRDELRAAACVFLERFYAPPVFALINEHATRLGKPALECALELLHNTGDPRITRLAQSYLATGRHHELLDALGEATATVDTFERTETSSRT